MRCCKFVSRFFSRAHFQPEKLRSRIDCGEFGRFKASRKEIEIDQKNFAHRLRSRETQRTT